MKELNIEFSDKNLSEEEIDVLKNIMDAYQEKCKTDRKKASYSFLLRDEKNKIYGGITSARAYNEYRIRMLCVDEKLRGQDYGTKLIKKAEEHARKLNLEYITLTTLEFQAPKFYQKIGFKIEFIRESKNPLLKQYFFSKKLI